MVEQCVVALEGCGPTRKQCENRVVCTRGFPTRPDMCTQSFSSLQVNLCYFPPTLSIRKKLLLVSLQVHSTLLLLYFILFHFTWLSLVDLRLCPGHLRFWVTSRISNWFTAFKTSEMLLYFRLSWLNLFYSTPLLSCHRGFTPLLSACSACVWLREPTHVIGSSRHHKVNRFQSLSIWIKGNELEMPTWFWSADKKIFR